jgi:hypothetical protein
MREIRGDTSRGEACAMRWFEHIQQGLWRQRKTKLDIRGVREERFKVLEHHQGASIRLESGS